MIYSNVSIQFHLQDYLLIFAVIWQILAFKISIYGMPNQNWVWGVYIHHKYWDKTRFRQKKLHVYDFQVRLWVAAFLAFLVLKFWKCGKMWPSTSKWAYTDKLVIKEYKKLRRYLFWVPTFSCYSLNLEPEISIFSVFSIL